MKKTDQEHAKNFTFLTGKTIASVRYVGEAECTKLMWHKRPLIIIFTDGSFIVPQSDDEGNDGGAMYYQDDAQENIIYTL
jgi:hypothetical protein